MKNLPKLQQLTDAVYAAELAKVADFNRQEQHLRQRLVELKAPVTPDGISPFALAGADLKWQSWIAESRRALNIELSRVLAAKERARAGLFTALGKQQAVKKLIENQSLKRRNHTS
ncbi:hypothetical protein [Marivivens aquimaris]|uniref:hypothetical protein n=1 Tax=Marivivens aquimaris TaxID=2774876 RepID=UPI001882E3E4|nr:hypothetical protein [Marivivens aquimaris]